MRNIPSYILTLKSLQTIYTYTVCEVMEGLYFYAVDIKETLKEVALGQLLINFR